MIEVVSAVIIRAGRILLTQRRPEKDFPFAWECPGGKVEEGEDRLVALRREICEEINCEIDFGTENVIAVWRGDFHNMVQRSERAHVHVSFYRVALVHGEVPRANEGQGLGWFTAKEMLALTLAPANVKACAALVRLCVEGSR